jgi:hypothetical protein
MGIEEEIRRLEEEIKNTPYNKATEHHIGRLKAKLAKLKEEVKKSKAPKGHGFFVKKTGDASVAIIGPPSVGKSTLLNKLTNARSKVGDYGFTTTQIIPGMMEYGGCKIQLLDLPGIIYGASEGKGRGREIIAMARAVDLILIMVDVYTIDEIEYIKKELWNAGIRINQRKPDVIIRKKDRGGINIEFAKKCKLSHETAKAILMEYMSNADVVIRDDITDEQLIDAILGNRAYLPAMVTVNKIDVEKVKVNTDMDVVYISAKNGYGLEELKKKIFEKLELVRVYMRPEGKKIEDEPMVLKKGATIKDVCLKLHRDFVKNFRYAIIDGPSASFPGQRVGLTHEVKDGDIITIVSR